MKKVRFAFLKKGNEVFLNNLLFSDKVGYIPRAYVDVIGKYGRSKSNARILYSQSSFSSRTSIPKRDSLSHPPMVCTSESLILIRKFLIMNNFSRK